MTENYGDMAIPEIKLIQNVGGSEAKALGSKPGDFYCSITGEIIPGAVGFEIVVAGPAKKTRTYWGTTEIAETPPICASPDGILSVNGENCQNACPHKAYNDAPYLLPIAERRTKCTPNFHIVAIKVSDMMPILIRCGGISAMAARELNTLLKFHKNIRGQYFKAKIKVTSLAKKTPSGEAYAIKFGEPQPLEEYVIAEVKEQLMLLSGVEVPALPVDDGSRTPEQIQAEYNALSPEDKDFANTVPTPVIEKKDVGKLETKYTDVEAVKAKMEPKPKMRVDF
jgi:hypothetical protein